MQTTLFIIAAASILQFAHAQDTTSLKASPETFTATSVRSTTTVPSASTFTNSTEFKEISIMDYKNVYEAATIEEEVQMATERFNLSKAQQEVWATAAVNRRQTEKQTRAKLESKDTDYNRHDVFMGLKLAHNEFHETITGYFDPSQKQALEKDRIILEEKRKMIAKLPPPIVAPTITVAPVDSAAIYESEKSKKAKKRFKTKKKTIGT